MVIDLRQCATFGVAGNFTGHLEQAGEAADFKAVKTAEAKAPKALFPTYIPHASAGVPQYLGIFPFDEQKIIFPRGEQKLQIEPECAMICALKWEGSELRELKPLVFGASNDCSIRKQGAKKISEKKNWGPSSKGFAPVRLPIDHFSKGGIMDRYRIASFLIRDGVVHAYGEDSGVRDYNYFYEKLLSWVVDRFNHQQNEGPAEQIGAYMTSSGRPELALISIGATRYTDYGEHNFLQDGDQAVVVLYPEDRYSKEEIVRRAGEGSLEASDLSVLSQKMVLAYSRR